MSLKDIIRKDPIITTISVQFLRDNPAVCEERYGRHYATYVSIPEICERWERVVKRISSGRPVLGAVYAPYGYGKTGAAIELWSVCQEADIISVPPFMCTMVNDILEATHSWVSYKLKQRRPEYVDELEEIYRKVRLRTNEEWVCQIAQEHGVSESKAREILLSLQQQGNLRLDALPSNVLRYLRKATDIILNAGFKGLLVVPDEFKLFAEFSSDSDANISHLTELVWGVLEEDRPMGLVFFMPENTFSEIRLKSGDITQRLGAHQVILNLHQVYDTSFPKTLWEQMSKAFGLTIEEKSCIAKDVLVALGQFCNKTDFFNGPRSVVATFKRAALKYQDTGDIYNIFDFVKDYTSGIVVFDGKESSTKGAMSSLINLNEEEDSGIERAIQLLAVFPDGCPEQIAEHYGLKEHLDAVTRKHLGDYIITQVLGPTLRIYKIGEEGDVITENLRFFRNRYNPKDASVRRAALRAFWNFIIPKILHERKGSGILGWTGYSKWSDTNGFCDFKQAIFTGGSSKEYPFRRVNLRITTNHKFWSVDTEDVHLGVAILLDADDSAIHNVEFPNSKKCHILLPIGRVIDTKQIPGDIAKLRDIFLPRDVTPLLLLSIADFMEKNILQSQAVGEQEKRQARFVVETSITQRVIKELFSEDLRLNSGYKNLPIGEKFLEQLLTEIFTKTFPEYVTIKAVPNQILEKYVHALESSTEPQLSLAQKRGHHEISDTKSKIANKFGYSSHATFRETVKSHWITLMDLINWEGTRNDSIATIRLKHHPLEKILLDKLKASKHGELVLGKKVKAIPVSFLYNHASDLGYLEEETDYIIRLLIARGYCSQIERKGVKVLHETVRQLTAFELQQAYETFIEELNKVCEIEKIDASEIFINHDWDLREDINQLIKQEKENQDIEVALDEKQHKLEILNSALQQFIAQKIVETVKKLNLQIQLCVQGKNRTFPDILNSNKKPIPTTDFSPLLQDLQVRLENHFVQQQNNYESLRTELQISYDKYEEAKKSKVNHIKLLRDLKQSLGEGQERLNNLDQSSKLLEQYINDFKKWFALADDVSRLRLQLLQQKDKNVIASNLLNELNKDIIFKIKEHLANKKLEALSNWEVFQDKIEALQNKWDKAIQERRKAFLASVEEYQKLLKDVGISKVELDARYDDTNPNLSRKRLLQDVKKHIDEVRTKARQYLNSMRNEILKANKIYGIKNSEQATDVESEWSNVESSLGGIFERLTDEIVVDPSKFKSWLNELKPFIEPQGIIAQLDHKVKKTVQEIAKIPLEPDEEQVFEVIMNHAGNLTEAFVQLLNEKPEYQSIEDILTVIIELYKKGRVNLEAKPINRT